jgi:hypothetical protein
VKFGRLRRECVVEWFVFRKNQDMDNKRELEAHMKKYKPRNMLEEVAG